MAAKKRPRTARRRGGPLLKIVLMLCVVLSTALILTLRAYTQQANREYESLRQQAAVLVAENDLLNERINDLGSVESAIRIAMEELGLVEPDTIVIDPRD